MSRHRYYRRDLADRRSLPRSVSGAISVAMRAILEDKLTGSSASRRVLSGMIVRVVGLLNGRKYSPTTAPFAIQLGRCGGPLFWI